MTMYINGIREVLFTTPAWSMTYFNKYSRLSAYYNNYCARINLKHNMISEDTLN